MIVFAAYETDVKVEKACGALMCLEREYHDAVAMKRMNVYGAF